MTDFESKKIRDEVPSSHQVRIINPFFSDPIVGHLPEEFGFGMGSEFTEPFSNLVPDSGFAGTSAQVLMGANFRKGIIAEKFYAGSEPSDISFDLQFNSFYSAYEEVVIPILKLLMLSVGINEEVVDESNRVEIENQLEKRNFFDQLPDDETSQKAREWISDFNLSIFISHETSIIKFGDVYELRDVYIQSVDFTFSNIMEKGKNGKGFPVQGNTSISAVFRKPPSQGGLGRMFAGTGTRVRNLR